MTLNFPAMPPFPDLADGANYNQAVLDMFSHLGVSIVQYMEGLSAEDFFQVMSSLSDTTAGKVLINGGHGLGGVGINAPNGDCNDITASGLYTFDSAAVNSPPFTNNGTILHISRTGDIHTQLAISRATSSLGRIAVRAKDGTSWSDWEEILTTASGGVAASFASLSLSGNAIVGTPDPWTFASSWRGVKLTARHALQATPNAGSVALSSNCAIGPSGWEYTIDATAGNYTISGGAHIFNRAVAGVAGNPTTFIETARLDEAGAFKPGSDNSQPLGTAAKRWSVVYAGSGTINTSDARSKEQVTDLDAAETRVAITAKGLLKKYRFKEAVAVKGDKARWHFGVIAQDLAAAFEAEGLAAFDYGVMCWDEWWEADVQVPAVYVDKVIKQFDEEGNLLTEPITEAVLAEPARIERRAYESEEDAPDDAERFDRYGVRYDELFAFILAAL